MSVTSRRIVDVETTSCVCWPEVFLGPCQKSLMELLEKMVNGEKQLIIFVKNITSVTLILTQQGAAKTSSMT